jgi:hypothetical protein
MVECCYAVSFFMTVVYNGCRTLAVNAECCGPTKSIFTQIIVVRSSQFFLLTNPGLTSIFLTRLKKLGGDKRPSLFQPTISDKDEKVL